MTYTTAPVICILCEGTCYSLGTLGSLEYFRCRACGFQFHHTGVEGE